MASELAKRLASWLPEAEFIGDTILRDYVPRQRMIDAELQEVREFIDAVLDASSTVKDSGLYQRGLELRRRLNTGENKTQ